MAFKFKWRSFVGFGMSFTIRWWDEIIRLSKTMLIMHFTEWRSMADRSGECHYRGVNVTIFNGYAIVNSCICTPESLISNVLCLPVIRTFLGDLRWINKNGEYSGKTENYSNESPGEVDANVAGRQWRWWPSASRGRRRASLIIIFSLWHKHRPLMLIYSKKSTLL